MKKYLIDANLPKVFSFFNSEEFVHVSDINPKMPDNEIWQYAIENSLVILSKDVDFYKRIKHCNLIVAERDTIKVIL